MNLTEAANLVAEEQQHEAKELRADNAETQERCLRAGQAWLHQTLELMQSAPVAAYIQSITMRGLQVLYSSGFVVELVLLGMRIQRKLDHPERTTSVDGYQEKGQDS